MQEYHDKVIQRIRQLGIEELKDLNTLSLLKGDYINLECKLPNGKIAKILDDDKMYLANQIEQVGTEQCYGIAADESQIAIFKYGCNGADAQLVIWAKL